MSEGPGRLSEQLIHEGRIVRLSLDQVRMPDGSVTEREFIHHVGASAIVPLLGEPGNPEAEILLIRQYRYTVGGEILEIPAGMRNSPEESFMECALRELREETGYTAGQIAPLTPIWTTPGFTDEQVHLYLAWELTRGDRDLDHDEFVELIPTPMTKALEMVQDGRIVDAKTIAALLWVDRFVRSGNDLPV